MSCRVWSWWRPRRNEVIEGNKPLSTVWRPRAWTVKEKWRKKGKGWGRIGGIGSFRNCVDSVIFSRKVQSTDRYSSCRPCSINSEMTWGFMCGPVLELEEAWVEEAVNVPAKWIRVRFRIDIDLEGKDQDGVKRLIVRRVTRLDERTFWREV